jgi:hypothetical protein
MRQLIVALTLLLLVLVPSCDTAVAPPLPPPTDRDGATVSVRLEPAIAAVTIDETIEVLVTVARSADATEPLTLRPAPGETLPAGLVVSTLTLAATQTAGTLAVSVDDRLSPGLRFVPLEARSGGIVKLVQLGLEVRAPYPRIDAAYVEDAPGSNEARQGRGPIVLVLEGAHFDRVSAFRLEDLDVTAAPDRTDDRVRLTLDVPHGLPPGPRALATTTTRFGETVHRAALTITRITAGPDGDDGQGHGTDDHPFRSLTRALGVAGDGDTVWLRDGRYDATTGEAWTEQAWDATLEPTPLPLPTVPDGVTIRGASRGGVVLAGSFLGGGAPIALAFAGSGRLERLTMTDFATAVLASTGEVHLDGIDLLENSEGVVAIGQAHVIVDATFVQGTFHDALRALGDARLTVLNTLLDDNLWGATIGGDALLEMDDVLVTSSGLDGLRVLDRANAVIHGTTVDGSNLAGIHVTGGHLVLRESTLSGNGAAGLLVSGEPQLVDLGRLIEAGGNTLSGNVPYQLHDARAERAALDGVVITLRDTAMQGVTPTARIEAGPVTVDDQYRIDGTNNLIEFF